MITAPLQLCSKNDCKSSVNDISPYIMENPMPERQFQAIIILSAVFQGDNRYNNIATMS